MPTITSVQTSPRNPSRIEVVLEPRSRLLVDIDTALQFGLRAGAVLDDATYEALRAAADSVRVYDRALAMVAFRPRAARELERQLVRKGEHADAADAAVARLVARGLLDDEAFARQYARSKLVNAGLGRARVTFDLARKGVARDVAERAVRSVALEEGAGERDTLMRMAEKKLRSLAGLAPDVQKRRLFGFLARRGFAQGDIVEVARRLLDLGWARDARCT